MERALVGIVEHGRERDMDEPALLGRVHVEQRRREQRMREPETAGRVLVDDPRGAELVQLGAVDVDDSGIDPPERCGGQPRRPRRVGQAREPRAQRGCKRLGHVLEIPGRGDLERVERAAAREPGERLHLWGRQRPAGSLEDDPCQLPLPEPADLDPVQRAPVAFGEARQLEIEARRARSRRDRRARPRACETHT